MDCKSETCHKAPITGGRNTHLRGREWVVAQLGAHVSRFSLEAKEYRHMPAASSEAVTMIEMVFPDQTNHYGTFLVATLCSAPRLPVSGAAA